MSDTSPQKRDTNITAAMIGAGATIIVALISLVPQFLNRAPFQNNNTPVPSATALPPSETPAPPTFTATNPPTAEAELLYKESFDKESSSWSSGDSDHSTYTAKKSVENGVYRREMRSKNVDSTYATVLVPVVPVQNFCFLFTASTSDTAENSAVMIDARANDYGQSTTSYYSIRLSSDGTGNVSLDAPGESGRYRVGEIENGPLWNDGQMHTIKISFQDDLLEIYDDATGVLIAKMEFHDETSMLTKGELRIGLEIQKPNQQSVFSLDEIKVYDRCP